MGTEHFHLASHEWAKDVHAFPVVDEQVFDDALPVGMLGVTHVHSATHHRLVGLLRVVVETVHVARQQLVAVDDIIQACFVRKKI